MIITILTECVHHFTILTGKKILASACAFFLLFIIEVTRLVFFKYIYIYILINFYFFGQNLVIKSFNR